MAEFVYALCALTSLLCAILLIRSYRTTRTRLLLWSSCCFVGLAVNNALLFVDLILFPSVSLELWRSLIALAAMTLLLVGLIWEAP